jgi:hypothetical protein
VHVRQGADQEVGARDVVGVENDDELPGGAHQARVHVAGLGVLAALPPQVPHALVQARVAKFVRTPVVQHVGLVRHLHVASGAHRSYDNVDRLAAHGDEHVDAGAQLAGDELSTPAEHVRGVGPLVVGQDGPPRAECLEDREAFGQQEYRPQPGVAPVGGVEQEEDVEDGGGEGHGHHDPSGPLDRSPGQVVGRPGREVIVPAGRNGG